MGKRFFASAALALAGVGLASCGAEPAEQAETAPEGMPGVTVTDARLVLPAVKGNPGAIYFELTYGDAGTTDRVALRSAELVGAKSTVLHDNVDWAGGKRMMEMSNPIIAKGETLTFEPGGKHVMAFDLDESLVAGGTTELTLTFAGGDKISVPAEIRGAGDER